MLTSSAGSFQISSRLQVLLIRSRLWGSCAASVAVTAVIHKLLHFMSSQALYLFVQRHWHGHLPSQPLPQLPLTLCGRPTCSVLSYSSLSSSLRNLPRAACADGLLSTEVWSTSSASSMMLSSVVNLGSKSTPKVAGTQFDHDSHSNKSKSFFLWTISLTSVLHVTNCELM